MENVKNFLVALYRKCFAISCFVLVVFVAAKTNCRITFENGKIDICPLQNTYIDQNSIKKTTI